MAFGLFAKFRNAFFFVASVFVALEYIFQGGICLYGVSLVLTLSAESQPIFLRFISLYLMR